MATKRREMAGPPELSAGDMARVIAALQARQAEVKGLLAMLEPFDGYRYFLELKRVAGGKLAAGAMSDGLRWLLPEILFALADPPPDGPERPC
jgi:hypothetical protein